MTPLPWNKSDISNNILVRKYGVRGAKIFACLWFPFMFVLLTTVNVASWVVVPEIATSRGGRFFFGCIFSTLTVVAASILTRMCLDFLREIKELESRGTPV
jgi:hypothetical protein